MKDDKKYIIKLIRNATKNKLANSNGLTLLNKGRFANAYVYRYVDLKYDVTIKDFHHCHFIIRAMYGRVMAKKEFKKIRELNGVDGITSNSYMLSPYTCAYTYIKGVSIKKSISTFSHPVPECVFIRLEEIVNNIHKREIVHLDLRNYGNVIVDDNDNPYIIDFQTSISTKYLPRKLKNLLQKIDMSGVYKIWYKCNKESMSEERIIYMKNFERIRKLWPFKGYPITRLIERIRNKP